MDDVTRAFVAEARVNLGVLQNGLAISLSAPSPAAVGADALSAARSIRRAAALLNLPAVETAAGSIENLLASVSAPGRFLQHPDLQLLSRAAAALGEMLDQIELVGAQGIVDQSQLFAALRAVQPVLVGAPHPNASSTAPAGGESRTRPEPVFGGAPPVRAAGRTPDLSLYDVAALMVQLEGHDREGAGRLAEALRRIGGQALLPQEVLPSLSAAIEALDEVARGTAAEPDDRLAEAGRLIEEVTNALEDSGYPETAASAADPADSEATYLPPDADRELLGEFVTESRECINDAEAALLSLEVDPDNVEAVNTVFRAFHTIKGTSGFLSLPRVSELAHHAESLLSRMRNREIRCEGGYADLALRSVDMVKGLIEQVHGALGGKAMAAPPGYDRLLCLLVKAEAEPAAETVEAAEEPIDGHLRIGDILVAADKVDREQIDAVAASKGSEPLGIALVKSKAVSLTDVAKALRVQQRMAAGERIQESSVRVRTERLDRLIDMVGELVIAHAMVAQDATIAQGAHHEMAKKISHAGKIVRELQDLSMSIRMVPFRATFQRMARLSRDLARKSGKLVDFIAQGEETEIDRNMVDLITDPLVHMVRNAVDHGVETPEERRQAGKPPAGVLRLSAYHSGGNVVVELEDDGRGLDRDRIVGKAIETGLIDSDKGLSDTEVFGLIFSPGFSTASEVTDVSGRGVGLDVVKRNIEALRGRIEISSVAGAGCKFWLRLPLTLAITDGMLVKVGNEHFIIPTVSIHLSFRPSAPALSTVAGRGDLVMLRGDIMPMFRLHRLFEVRGAVEDPTKGLLVVVGDGNRRCALLVDELLGQQQVVAKSLGRALGKIQGVSGGAILGDGRVGLILDTLELAALARQTSTAFDVRGDGDTAGIGRVN